MPSISEGVYAGEVGDKFIELRGAGFDLSPLDLELISEWQERGIPLHIPIGTMNDAASWRASKCPEMRIRSLSYFTEEVEARYAEWLEGRVGAH
jgi:hypothetical protein